MPLQPFTDPQGHTISLDVTRILAVARPDKITQVHMERAGHIAVFNLLDDPESVTRRVNERRAELADELLYRMLSGEGLSAFELRVADRMRARMRETLKVEHEKMLVEVRRQAVEALDNYITELEGGAPPPKKPKGKGKAAA